MAHEIKYTYVIKYTPGSGPTSQTFRGCCSQEEAEARFWCQPQIEGNSQTVVVSIESHPG
jgi:hypothetical protein